jgi:hypothetical protein
VTQPDAPAVPVDEPLRTTPPSRRPRWLPWSAAATVALLLGLAAAWWMFWSEPVVVKGGYGVTFHDAEPERPYTVAVELLCLDGPERARVDDVTVDRAGLTVVDFAVRPRPEPPAVTLGAVEEHLADTGFGRGRSFSGQCDVEAFTELAVELRRDGVGPAHTETLDVHWSAGVRSGVLRVPVSVTLCPAGDETELCAGAP